jgi:UDP-N-acetylmuramoyl-tripeptide--D-alanyl-D-alanine ligase
VKALSLREVQRAVSGRWLARPEAEPLVTSVVTDSRAATAGALFVALPGERVDGHDFVLDACSRGAVGAVVSRPVGPLPTDRFLIQVPETVAALGALARYYRSLLSATVIGVTGSNGKTTTKEMVAHLLAANAVVVKAPKSFNNFIGVPLTLLSIEPQTDFAVLELGTSAPGEIRRLATIARPHIGVITNIGPTHLEYLGNVAGVAKAKAELLDVLGEEGTAVLNWDDDWCRRVAPKAVGKLVTFGLTTEADVFATGIVQEPRRFRFLLNGVQEVVLPVAGIHNLSNALAAAAVARRAGLNQADIAGRFADFRLPSMRLEEVVLGEVTFINDAYNANPVSMSAALSEFARREAAGRKLFVAGDMKELGPESARYHRELGLRVAAHHLDRLFAVGEFAGEVVAGAVAGGFPVEAAQAFATVDELVSALLMEVRAGDAVLVKGSRAMQLERVIEAARESLLSGKVR